MIDLFDLWEKFCGENNTHQNGHVRPERNFVNWVNAISQELFEQKFKNGWQRSQKITDDIGLPFLASKVVQVMPGSATFDIIPFPDEYGHFSACRFFRNKETAEVVAVEIPKPCCPEKSSPDDEDNFYYENLDEGLEEVAVELVPNNKWSAISRHAWKKPTLDQPKITQYSEGYKIAPKGISYVVIDYLKRPKPATFAYTVGPDDEIVYDATNSIKLQWTPSVETEFLTRLSRKYGKFTKQADIYQAASTEITQT